MKYFYRTDSRSVRGLDVYDGFPSRGQCKYCGSKMVNGGRTVQQRGESYTDDVDFCYKCGWWEFVMREPWTASTYHGALFDFKNEDETIRSVKDLLEEVAIGKKELLHASPREFEKIAYAYFRDTIDGSVQLTIPSRDGGFDLWCVDSSVGPFIVEAKRYRETIGISIVRNLLGVMVYNKVKRGVVFHASALTRDSNRFVQDISKRGEWQIESRSTEDIMAWLRLSARDFDPSVLWSHIKSLSLNGDDFTVPMEFFDPSTHEQPIE